MELYKIATGELQVKDSSFQHSETVIAICDVKTAQYLDGNKKLFDMFKMDGSDLRQMDCFDTLYPGRENRQGLERLYKQARLYDAAEPYVKQSVDGNGDLICYRIQSRVIVAKRKLLFCSVTPYKAFEHS